MADLRRLLAIPGTLLIGCAVVLAVWPGVLGDTGLPGGGSTVTIVITILLVVIFGLYGVMSFRGTGVERDEIAVDLDPMPEMVEDGGGRVIGLDGADPEASRAQLVATVEAVLRRQYDYSRGDAGDAIARGDWTRDRVAAAFLDTGVSYPLFERLRAWLEEDGTVERRLDRTVAAIEALHEEGDTG